MSLFFLWPYRVTLDNSKVFTRKRENLYRTVKRSYKQILLNTKQRCEKFDTYGLEIRCIALEKSKSIPLGVLCSAGPFLTSKLK